MAEETDPFESPGELLKWIADPFDFFAGEGPSAGVPSYMPTVQPAPVIGPPQMQGLNAAQQATLGLFRPEVATPYASFQMPGGVLAPIASQRQIAGGVGGPLPTQAQAQAGQAPQLFGAAATPRFGGMYGAVPPWLMPPPPPGPPHKVDPALLTPETGPRYRMTIEEERARRDAMLTPTAAVGERTPSGGGNIFALSGRKAPLKVERRGGGV